MFTGIITHLGVVKKIINNRNQDTLITISLNLSSNQNEKQAKGLEIGCSIACNGICLTLIKKNQLENQKFELDFQASQETINKTNIHKWKIGQIINIEFSLKIGDELGGHLVSGHIDETIEICNILSVKDSWQFYFSITESNKKFIIPKGSATINGVSLTINETSQNNFMINIIPHTFENTNFKYCKIGDLCNLEVDLIARYLANLINK
ncbi:MAG: riboflavin synthase [Rickettsiales bacterium]|jgi:riboflavin synthase|nr:riboflavin synthase [Rickettsiales bacterium]